MDYSENSDEETHYHDPNETYEQDLHSSNPSIATFTDSSSNWQDDSESINTQSQVPNSMQDCMNIASQMLPELVEDTSAHAQSQKGNLSIMLGLARKI